MLLNDSQVTLSTNKISVARRYREIEFYYNKKLRGAQREKWTIKYKVCKNKVDKGFMYWKAPFIVDS